MKKSIITFLYVVSFLAPALAKTNIDAISTLKNTAKRLNEAKTLSYHYEREINNIKSNYFNKTAAECILIYETPTRVIPFIFQFKNDSYQHFFNGTEYFALNGNDKTITLNEKPTAESFSNFSYFYNSIPTLKSLLSQIADDTSIPKILTDTIIGNKKYPVVNFSLKNKALNFLSYRSFSIELTVFYKLIIDPATLFPYQVIENNSNDKDLYQTKTTFTNINTDPKLPEEKSWFYTTYLNAYQPKQTEKSQKMIAIGDQLNAWSLPVFGENGEKTVSNSDFKGKLVMFDFWIKNCSYCMESFPYLKTIQEKYGKENFQLLTVNAYEDQKEIDFFYKREKPTYMMLYQGKELSNKLGILAYPTVVIVGKNEKVVYAGAFNKDVIDKIIKQNL